MRSLSGGLRRRKRRWEGADLKSHNGNDCLGKRKRKRFTTGYGLCGEPFLGMSEKIVLFLYKVQKSSGNQTIHIINQIL